MLNKELNAGLADVKIKPGSWSCAAPWLEARPREFATILSEATEKWAMGDQGRGHQGRIGPFATVFRIFSVSRGPIGDMRAIGPNKKPGRSARVGSQADNQR